MIDYFSFDPYLAFLISNKYGECLTRLTSFALVSPLSPSLSSRSLSSSSTLFIRVRQWFEVCCARTKSPLRKKAASVEDFSKENADVNQTNEGCSETPPMANVSPAQSRLKIVMPASRKTTTSKNYAKPLGVDDNRPEDFDDDLGDAGVKEQDGVVCQQKKRMLKLPARCDKKRKTDKLGDDYEDDYEEDDEDVPLTLCKSQLEKRRKKGLDLGNIDSGSKSKKKDKEKAPMPDLEDDGDDFAEDMPLTLRKHRLDQRKKGGSQKEIMEDKKKKDKGKAKLVEHEDVVFDSDDEDARPVTRNERKLFSKIKHQGQLSVFVEAVQKLNAVQRKQVAEIGFGSFLKLCSIEIPCHLCRWLVENYYPRKAKIVLPDGSALEVSDIDVEICLGIPRGQVEVVKVDPKTKMYVMEA